MYPRRTEYFDCEAEAAIVIGKRGKNIRAADIADYVWGVTLLNDWSIRDGMGGPQQPMSYNTAKTFGGSASLGPCIVAGEVDVVPGDIIAGGTAASTAADKTKRGPDGARPKDLFLKVNDVVEITSPQIGKPRNRVVP